MLKNNILIYVGSFKPPHKGHFKLVKSYIKKFDKIYIIISKKSRPLDRRLKDINKLDLLSINSILGINSKSKVDAIKKYNKLLMEGKVESINSSQSKEIWDIYKDYLDKRKLSILISPLYSPVMYGMMIYNKIDKLKNNVYFLKSEKNKNNRRFGDKVEIIGKYFNKINSTDIREKILKKKKTEFNKYLPKELNKVDRERIWKILKY